jgi:hypothetical protein
MNTNIYIYTYDKHIEDDKKEDSKEGEKADKSHDNDEFQEIDKIIAENKRNGGDNTEMFRKREIVMKQMGVYIGEYIYVFMYLYLYLCTYVYICIYICIDILRCFVKGKSL